LFLASTLAPLAQAAPEEGAMRFEALIETGGQPIEVH